MELCEYVGIEKRVIEGRGSQMKNVEMSIRMEEE